MTCCCFRIPDRSQHIPNLQTFCMSRSNEQKLKKLSNLFISYRHCMLASRVYCQTIFIYMWQKFLDFNYVRIRLNWSESDHADKLPFVDQCLRRFTSSSTISPSSLWIFLREQPRRWNLGVSLPYQSFVRVSKILSPPPHILNL